MRAGALFWLLAAAAAFAQNPAHPFPQHTVYTAGTILPSVATQSQRDAAVANFYDAWKARYLHAGCVAGQLYIFANRESSLENSEAITVSEAHGYGMLITALMAGHDPAAQTEFDELYAYFRAHPSSFTPELMAWMQVAGCQSPKGDDDSATDGDLDIAYALLLADAQWGSAGKVHYRVEALRVIAGIKSGDINVKNPSIKLGDWVDRKSKNANDTRLSDFLTNHFRAFYRATGDKLWPALIGRCYSAASDLQNTSAPATGLVPDFARKLNTPAPEPARADFLESKFDGEYSYNSCRFPFRIGVDYLLAGDPRAKLVLEKLNDFLQQTTGGDPAKLRAGYYIKSGRAIHDDEHSLAFSAPLAVSAMIDARNQEWLDKLWTQILATPIDDDSADYFGSTLKLLSLLVVSGDWWAP